MALDGAYLYTVKQELKDLIRGRIDKIYQPSKDEIIISIRTVKGTFKLLISRLQAAQEFILLRNRLKIRCRLRCFVCF